MITLDTNLWARYLLRDESRQADVVREFCVPMNAWFYIRLSLLIEAGPAVEVR